VTIVASRAVSAQDGYLGARLPIGAKLHAPQAFVLPCQPPEALDNGAQLYATIVRSENIDEWPEALDHRGWILQE
jgi:hypothetical protein